MLEEIDLFGIDSLRDLKEKKVFELYHFVMYEAFKDKLKITYSQIIKKLPQIQLRDSDVCEILNNRDWLLIKILLGKRTMKL